MAPPRLITTPVLGQGCTMSTAAHGPSVVDPGEGAAQPVADMTLADAFSAQVARTPDATAVVFADRRLTYAELDDRVRRLAHLLGDHGAGPDRLVGVALPRSVDLVVALLAAHRVGSAYLPLDTDYPPERLAFMVGDGRPALVLTGRSTPPWADWPGLVVDLDAPQTRRALAVAGSRPGPGGAGSAPEQLAYVIYTSGSTGRPKGVAVSHRAIVNRLTWMQAEYGLDAGDRVLQKTPSSFDVSVWEFFWTLSTGATLVLAEPGGHRDAQYLADLIAAEQITTVHFVPSMLEAFLAEPATGSCTSLRRVICSGEALPAQLRDRFHAVFGHHGPQLHNLYGPTEAAVDVTSWACSPGDEGAVPIGRPVWNTGLRVLDDRLQPLRCGQRGELYLAGVQLARGYLGRPGLTAERFVADPYGAAGSRMYRTGDVARWRDDGALEYLGRADDQVKVRGFRVELGEVEATLRSLPGVGQTAVATWQDPPPARLVAYVVAEPGERVEEDVLRRHLAARLPEHMVPSVFVALEAMPLSANGKLDRSALPAPHFSTRATGVAGRTPTEKLLCGLFAEVLGVGEVGVDDGFFALGGDSIRAMLVTAGARRAGLACSTSDLFAHPTPAGLAAALPAAGAGEAGDDGDARPGPKMTVAAPALDPAEAARLGAGGAEVLPLGPLQEGLLFHAGAGGSAGNAYVVQLLVGLDGFVDTAALAGAARMLLRRHPALRATFVRAGDGTPVQVVAGEDEVPLRVVDLAEVPDQEAPDGEAEARRVADEERERPFDPASGPLLRLALVRLGGGRCQLVLTVHHLVVDGWSLPIVVRELGALVAGGGGAALAPVRPYRDYLAWVAAQDRERSTAAWASALAGLAGPTRIGTPQPPDSTAAAGEQVSELHLDEGTTTALGEMARAYGLTLNTVVQGAWAMVLGALTDGDDVVFGTTVAGRPAELAGVEAMVGLFVNTIPVRVRVDRAEAVVTALSRLQAEQAALMAHHHVSLAEIQHAAGVQGPLFDSLVVFENYPLGFEGRFGDGQLSVTDVERRDATHYPLCVTAVPGRRLTLRVAHRPGLVDAHIAGGAGRWLVRVLEAVAADPARRVGTVALVSPEERSLVIAGGNGPARRLPELTLPELFEEQARHCPGQVAVVAGAATLTYAELDAAANRLARLLRSRGAGPDDVVALALPRTTDLVVGVLAVLKAGAAVLPLDASHPPERLAFQLADARPACIVATAATAAALPAACRPIVLDAPALTAQLAGYSPGPLTGNGFVGRPGQAERAAYVIYTSGSTGTPKGVVVPHRGLTNLFHAQLAGFINPEVRAAGGRRLRAALLAPAIFDAFWEPVLWMVAGHELHVVGDEVRLDPERLVALVRDRRIDVVDTTPSYLPQLLAAGLLEGGRHRPAVVSFGGEAAPAALWDQLRADPAVSAYNFYGPTECTVDALWCRVADHVAPMVGRPLVNTAAYVLDHSLQPVPDGVAGELYLAGAGLARGYLNRPGLTAARFVAHPFGPPGARLYRTGDLVRRLEDASIEFLGRTDDQVKIRGFRVEPREVEAVLSGHAGVAAAAVVAHGEGAETRLAAYVVPVAPGAADQGELRRHLSAWLPDHLVPAACVLVDALPTTANGKLDRRALPAPDFGSQAGGRPPRHPREEILCELFAEVLGLDRVGIDDDFFALGGHSLMAARLVNRVRRVLEVDLPVRSLFDTPTVARLAAALESARPAPPALRPLPRPDRVPLSFAQERLWFLHRLDGPSPTYNVPFALRLAGEADVATLQAALADVVGRHESLRTVFPDSGREGHQRVLPTEDAAVVLEVRAVAGDLEAELTAAARRPFDLAREIPLRAWLFSDEASHERVLLVVVHHIAADEWSAVPLLRDLGEALAARRAGRAPGWAPLPVQYGDFALWQRGALGDEADAASPLSRQLAFWTQALDGAPEQLDLPTDRPRPPVASHAGGSVCFRLPAVLHDDLGRLARRSGATMFMVLQAGLAALLTRLGAGTDIPIGTPVAGRGDEALDDLVGFFVNTLVLRADTSGNPSFSDLVARVRRADLAAFEHQEVPFERVVEALNPSRSLARHPLFQVMFVHHRRQPSALEAPERWAEPVHVDVGVAKVDLTLAVAEEPAYGGIEARLEYRRDLFEAATAEALAQRLVQLLEQAVADPDRPLGDLDVLVAAERQRLAAQLRASAAPLPDRTLTEPDETLNEMVAAQASATPGSTAVVAGGAALGYAELDARATRLAGVLAARGAAPERIVAVALPRSPELVVALLAVLRSGAAYLPIDLDYPPDRIAAMVSDADPVCLLTDTSVAGRLPAHDGVPRLLLDEMGEDAPASPPSPPSGANAAYVIYTSGSTGRPKGVVVEHRALVNFLLAMRDRFPLGPHDRMLAVTTVGFDIAGLELYLPLLCGAAVVMADKEALLDPPALLALARRSGVSVMQATPTLWRTVLAEERGELAGVSMLVGGEALPEALAVRMRSGGGRVTNLYGPTETTIWSTAADVGDEGGPPPLGEPIRNTQLHVLDTRLHPVPDGVPGELYIAGAGLARGYLGRPALTAERFVADPFGTAGTRMYRTGDLVRRRADGALEYLGRLDHQVKLRGFRIELGEVEAVLGAHRDVAEARVVLREDRPGHRQLVGYVVAMPDRSPAVEDLRSHLRARLAEYMVPAALVVTDALPLTPNGKLDRDALPAPDLAVASVARTPVTAAEEVLAQVFSDVLGLPRVGVDESFFDLGGDSIASIALVSRAREAGLAITPRDVFEHKTVEALAGRARPLGAPAMTGAGGGVAPTRPLVAMAPDELDEIEHDLARPERA